MIEIVETPQYADFKISHTTTDDVLTIDIDGTTEDFDFTELPEGKAEDILVEFLPVNPVMGIEKIGDIITVTLIRFYGDDEKEVFENGEDRVEIKSRY